nr:MAG: hypothetical protein DIU57_17720 [Pseudomonadota bacterium]
MTDAKSTANMLHQMAQLADELEAQGADIIGASLSSVGRYLQLSAHGLPASIAERGVNRERCVESDEIFYVDARGVRVCWLVPREKTSND